MRYALLLPALLAACASPGLIDNYNSPAWTREFCRGLDWERQGRSDAARFKDREQRLEALDKTCGIHMAIPKGEYRKGFDAVRG
ncbi:MAG: hypothetical protein AAF401_11735 [Pseudomonadota bacterium]